MPLAFSDKLDSWDGFSGAVVFAGEDAESQASIACAILHEALAEFFGAVPGRLDSVLPAFRRYRPAIERAASVKYDATGRPMAVLLTPDDIRAIQAASRARDAGANGRGAPPAAEDQKRSCRG